MFTPQVIDVIKRSRSKFKKHPYKSMETDPKGAFSRVPSGVMHTEDV